MWNIFRTRHQNNHRGIEALLNELTFAIVDLRDEVQELREDVDYLVDFLDD